MGDPNAEEAVLLIHGFGANTNHWRFNQPVLAELLPTYAIDLLGFGRSDQPRARLKDEPVSADAVHYGFDLWGQQVADFCRAVIDRPVRLGGQLHRRGRGPAGRTTAGGTMPGRGADRLRPALDGRQATVHPTRLDGLDPTVAQDDGAAALAQHRTVPQCRTARGDPQRVEAGLSQWRQHRRRTWWICCFNPPNAMVLQKPFAASSTCSTITWHHN